MLRNYKLYSLMTSNVINVKMFSTTHKSGSSKSNGRLNGKVAVVTASTEGIGYAIAEKLASEGAHIVISSRRSTNVEAATSKLKNEGYSVLGLTCHTSKELDINNLIEKAIETFGGIDILVSNAAVNPAMGGVLQCSGPMWDKIFEVNVKNALQITQLAVPHMQKRGGGSIVFVSSIAGFHPFPLLGPYSVSKTALLGLTKVLAAEVAGDNIRVNCVAPGIVNTKFAQPLLSSKELLDRTLDPIPMKRVAEPKEIAGTVLFLCSDDASYVTGENIVVAGGMPSRL